MLSEHEKRAPQVEPHERNVRVRMLSTHVGSDRDNKVHTYREGHEYILPAGPHPFPDVGLVFLQNHPCPVCTAQGIPSAGCNECSGTGAVKWAEEVGEPLYDHDASPIVSTPARPFGLPDAPEAPVAPPEGYVHGEYGLEYPETVTGRWSPQEPYRDKPLSAPLNTGKTDPV